MDKIGNAYGAAGLMGNLYAESGLKANDLQNSYNNQRMEELICRNMNGHGEKMSNDKGS